MISFFYFWQVILHIYIYIEVGMYTDPSWYGIFFRFKHSDNLAHPWSLVWIWIDTSQSSQESPFEGSSWWPHVDIWIHHFLRASTSNHHFQPVNQINLQAVKGYYAIKWSTSTECFNQSTRLQRLWLHKLQLMSALSILSTKMCTYRKKSLNRQIPLEQDDHSLLDPFLWLLLTATPQSYKRHSSHLKGQYLHIREPHTWKLFKRQMRKWSKFKCRSKWRAMFCSCCITMNRLTNPKVPMTRVVIWLFPAPSSLAKPKSDTLALKSSSISMLLDFISLWTTFGSIASCR